jgi:CO/xanthine dehydrogenase FAD-binding subunit
MSIIDARPRTLKEYYVATSVQDALAYLSAHRGESRLLGGGTLLMPWVQSGESPASRLVDISRICSIRRISRNDGYLQIGGTTTFAVLVASDLVRQLTPALFDAARRMGTPPIRHLATLGGNIISAVGHAQGLVALMALGAEVEITNLTGAQWLPMSALLARPGLSRVDSTAEVITSVRVPGMVAGQGSALAGLNPQDAPARDVLVLALALTLHEDGETVAQAVAVMGAAGALPVRMNAAEAVVVGTSIHSDSSRETFGYLLAEAAHATLEEPLRGAEQEVIDLADEVFRRAARIALNHDGA